MCEVPVFYASTDGQTRRIAERIAAELREQGLASAAVDLAAIDAIALDWSFIRGVCLGAPIRAGRHPASAVSFARRYHEQLSARPSMFFSVSLSAASAREEERTAAARIAQAFLTDAAWTPAIVASVAGRLAYTRYGWLTKWFMRRIARKEGGATDTSRDHELTDWAGVSALASRFAELLNVPLDGGTATMTPPHASVG